MTYGVVFWDIILSDVDGGGGDEVLVVERDVDFNFSVTVFDGNGDRLWSYKKPGKYPLVLGFSAQIYDLDGDGVVEMIINLDVERSDYSFGNMLYVFDATYGNLLWVLGINAPKGSGYSVIFGNLDGDGYVDMLLVDMLLFNYNFSIYLIAINGFYGSVLWNISILEENVTKKHVDFFQFPSDFIQLPLLFDLNGDGCDEVIFNGLKGKVYVLNGSDGSVIWDTLGIFDLIMDVSVVDLNFDFKPEILVKSLSSVGVLDGEDGKLIWLFPNFIYGFNGVKWVSIGDINGNGVLDFIIGVYGYTNSEYYQRIFVLYGDNGSVAWSKIYFLHDFYSTFNFFSEATLADLNGDGSQEIAVVAAHSFYVLDTKGTTLWSYNFPRGHFAFLSLIDLDVDGELEAVVVFEKQIYFFNFSKKMLKKWY